MSKINGGGGYVRITSSLDEPVYGRYDGEDYEFPPGEPVDVPVAVAAHVFGFGVPDKSAVLSRLGWVTDSSHVKAALEKLRAIRFEDVVIVARPSTDQDEPGDVSPLVNAGGTEGGSQEPPHVSG
jgi:hypothetical protein